MTDTSSYGRIVILNGAPRSGKSSIASEIQNTFDGVWINLGVDNYMKTIPGKYQPGIGLRPGGERPDLEPLIATLYQALYESIAAHSRLGVHVVADLGHHDAYSSPLGILPRCARALRDYPVLIAGVFCPIDEIMKRRIETWQMGYEKDGQVPAPVLRWQDAVHSPGIYDLTIDTSIMTPAQSAALIRDRLEDSRPLTAWRRLAKLAVDGGIKPASDQ